MRISSGYLSYINKKSVRTCTCYSSHVLRLSHCPVCRNEQRRPHADMYLHDQMAIPTTIFSNSTGIASGYATYISRDIYRCIVFDKLFENLRDSKTSKPKRQVNAFPKCHHPPTNPVGASDSAKLVQTTRKSKSYLQNIVNIAYSVHPCTPFL